MDMNIDLVKKLDTEIDTIFKECVEKIEYLITTVEATLELVPEKFHGIKSPYFRINNKLNSRNLYCKIAPALLNNVVNVVTPPKFNINEELLEWLNTKDYKYTVVVYLMISLILDEKFFNKGGIPLVSKFRNLISNDDEVVLVYLISAWKISINPILLSYYASKNIKQITDGLVITPLKSSTLKSPILNRFIYSIFNTFISTISINFI